MFRGNISYKAVVVDGVGGAWCLAVVVLQFGGSGGDNGGGDGLW